MYMYQGPRRQCGDEDNDKAEDCADNEKHKKKRGHFSFWFTRDSSGGTKDNGSLTTNKKNKTKSTKETTASLFNAHEFGQICDRTDDNGKSEALRRNKKLRSTSESSALDSYGPQGGGGGWEVGKTAATANGKLRLNVDHHRQTSKSAVHLSAHRQRSQDAAEEEEHPLEPRGNCTFDWWFHRKRRSSKNKSR